MLRTWFEITLWKRIMGMLVLGIVFGLVAGETAASISWMGDIFIRLIRMIVVPLVFITLVAGVVAMGDPKKLGSLGIKTMALYMGTTLFAVSLGLGFAAVIQPGVGVDLAGVEPGDMSKMDTKPVIERLVGIIPENPMQALVDNDMLAIIFFALMTGATILVVGKKGKPLADLFEAGSEMMLKMTHIVMEVAPFGVFALISKMIGTGGIGKLLDVLPLVVCFLAACFIQVLFTYSIIMKFLLKLSPVRFLKQITGAQLVALSTSSSSGSLPMTMTVAEENLGVSKTIASSVLPLGATINMDGSALYVGILAVFSAQVFGVPLGITEYILIAFAATIASIGVAAVPSASLFMLAAVLAVLDIDAAQTAIIVGFIFPFDRPLDMIRTVVNVSGDLTVATAVAKWEGELDEGVFNAAAVD